jgi:hypothetical protein
MITSIKNIKRIFAQNGGSGGGGVAGSGTINYIPKWTPTGFTLGNSIIQENSNKIGVGLNPTTSRVEALGEFLAKEDTISVFGLAASLRALTTSGGAQSVISTENTVNGNFARLITNINNNTFTLRSNSSSSFTIEDSAGLEQLRFTSQNNSLQNFIVYRNNLEFLNNVTGHTLLKLNNLDNIGISEANPTARIHVKGSDSTNSNFTLKLDNSSSSPLLYARNDGNVGIGTSTPTSKLQVVGLPTYANNSAAIIGGLTAGALYIRGVHGLDIVV